MTTDLLIVDASDQVTGRGEKLRVHAGGTLHRAFSVFIFAWERQQLLLQRRALRKYHSGGKWSNACCSHPRRDPLTASELNQRLAEELRCLPPCRSICSVGDPPEGRYVFCGKLRYQAWFDGLSEHEMDHVFVLFTDKASQLRLQPNPEEADAVRWVALPELIAWIQHQPEAFSAWFLPTFLLAYRAIYAECQCRKIPAITPEQLAQRLDGKRSGQVRVDGIL